MARQDRILVVLALWLQVVAPGQESGSTACAQCHPDIVKRYAATPMARSSGRISDIELPIPSTPSLDESTRANIRLKRTPEGQIVLMLQREAPALDVSRTLTHFIGSGRVGRSFLFAEENGFLYQSPISYYADGDMYRSSPGFERKAMVDLTRAVEPSCLLCHASGLQVRSGTQNAYDAEQPFREAGISCERCHGPGERHTRMMRTRGAQKGSLDRGIVNPAKLRPAERDSVCAQCHLTGVARVARASLKGRAAYTPGDDLTRSVAVFVWDRTSRSSLSVTSHFENLQESRCKQVAGDRLWCGTCHSPHGTPIQMRERCLGCHSTRKPCTFDITTRRTQADHQCQNCHMPGSEVRGVQHAVYTNHSIPRNPNLARVREMPAGSKELVPFSRVTPVDDRDLALGYAVAALTEPAVRRRAFDLLKAAAAKYPDDRAIATQLAQFHDRMGQRREAAEMYERVVAEDTSNAAALINLGTLYAQSNRLAEAIELWKKALSQNPALTRARMNLGVAQIRLGDREGGIASFRTALHFDPDNPELRQLLEQALR